MTNELLFSNIYQLLTSQSIILYADKKVIIGKLNVGFKY